MLNRTSTDVPCLHKDNVDCAVRAGRDRPDSIAAAGRSAIISGNPTTAAASSYGEARI
jgi:hypothetical protein